jgi:hypothetical protein
LGSRIYLANLNRFETPARDVHDSKPGQSAIEEKDKKKLPPFDAGDIKFKIY